MHERALMADLVRQVLRVAERAGAARVTGVEVRLGALSHFTPGHFREHFEDASRDSLAAGARLRLHCDGDPLAADAAGVRVLSVDVD